MLTYKEVGVRMGVTSPGARMMVKRTINKIYNKLVKKEKLSPLEALISLTSFLKINNEIDMIKFFDLFFIKAKKEIIKNGRESRIYTG